MPFEPPANVVSEDMIKSVLAGVELPYSAAHIASNINAMMALGYCTKCGLCPPGCVCAEQEVKPALADDAALNCKAHGIRPGSLWLVIIEGRYDVVSVCTAGKGFYAPGARTCWAFSRVSEWLHEISFANYHAVVETTILHHEQPLEQASFKTPDGTECRVKDGYLECRNALNPEWCVWGPAQ